MTSICRFFPVSNDLSYLQRDAYGPLVQKSVFAIRRWAKEDAFGFNKSRFDDAFIRSPEEIPNDPTPRLTVELCNKRTPLPEMLEITSNGLIFIQPNWSDSCEGLPVDSLAWPWAVFHVDFVSSAGTRMGTYIAGLPHFGWQRNLKDHVWIDWAKSRFCRAVGWSLMREDKVFKKAEENLVFSNGKEAEVHAATHVVAGKDSGSRVLRPLYPEHLALKLKAFPAFMKFETELFVSETIAKSRQGKAPRGLQVYEQNAFTAELV